MWRRGVPHVSMLSSWPMLFSHCVQSMASAGLLGGARWSAPTRYDAGQRFIMEPSCLAQAVPRSVILFFFFYYLYRVNLESGPIDGFQGFQVWVVLGHSED